MNKVHSLRRVVTGELALGWSLSKICLIFIKKNHILGFPINGHIGLLQHSHYIILRLWDSVMPTCVNYRTCLILHNMFCARDWSRDVRKGLETAKSSHLNHASNLSAGWLKKISLCLTIALLLEQGPMYQCLASWYKLLYPLVTAVSAARQLSSARLAFSDSKGQKTLRVALHHHESYRKV